MNSFIESNLVKAKVCVKHAKEKNIMFSKEFKLEVDSFCEGLIVGVKNSPEDWKSAWNFVFQHACSEKKAVFLKHASKVMTTEEKQEIDKQMLEDGSYKDSMYFCSLCDWANVPRHQYKVLNGTTSPRTCLDFYSVVPTASYYETQKALIKMKNNALCEKNKEFLKEANNSLEKLEKTMETSKIRRVRAKRELDFLFPVK